MTMSISERKKAAKEFSKRWKNRGREKQESQVFWLDLLQNVYNIKNPGEYIKFEDTVSNMMDGTSFMDGYIDKTNILIEQKGSDRFLNKGIRQSDGGYLTPFQQAKLYSANLPYSLRPRWIITSNFQEFYIYDMEKPSGDPAVIELKNLENEFYRLDILVDKSNTQIEKETEVSIKAGELIGEIYRELRNQYINFEDVNSQKSINQLCVRLVFCFYAEDAGLFGRHGIFHNYLNDFSQSQFRNAVIELFHVLNTKEEDRDPYLSDKLASFPFVNGGLFADMDIEVPQFTDHLRDMILKNASSDFDWSSISPTIFGSVFESTLNPNQRREGGMHYTSIENIHKVIDPLFLDDLKQELNKIRQLKTPNVRVRRALEFQDKLANLKFFDPACGSGNFLTETYLSLRELENEAFVLIYGDNPRLGVADDFIKVSLNQFYGIEVNDFAVSVAKAALWIAESQMFEKTKELVYVNIEFLPLKSYINIIEGNALTMEWDSVVDRKDLHYIIGNPPFIGYSNQSDEQTEELKSLYVDEKGRAYKGSGKIDYVAGWFMKASQFMNSSDIRTSFVATNSITQGEQVAYIWKPLFNQHGIHIDFAHKAFKWDSEASQKANVHVVIVGFSTANNSIDKIIYNSDLLEKVENINAYLIDAPEVFIDNQNDPISDVIEMTTGNRPADGGHLIIERDEYEDFIKQEPKAKKYIKKLTGGKEFINGNYRYCLWLVDADPSELRKMPLVMERIEKCKNDRLQGAKDRQKLADTPTLFRETSNPDRYLAIPATSSEKRKYVPIGFLEGDIIPTNAVIIIPNAPLYYLGILISNVHMAWMSTVAGRLEMRYRYSKNVVYNNFPWPELTDNQKDRITKTAQEILDARNLYPESSLADLYDDIVMPPELRKAHQSNDRAVMEAYGMQVGKTTERECVEQLFEMFATLADI